MPVELRQRISGLAIQAAVIAVGVLLSVLTFRLASDRDTARVLEHNEFRAAWRASDVSWKLAQPLDPVLAVAALMQASGDPDVQAIDRGTIDRLRGVDTLRSIAWMRRVPAGDREGFERRMRDAGQAEFRIVDVDAIGRLVPAPDRPEHLPAVQGLIFSGAPMLRGLDVAGLPNLAPPLARARDTGSATLSGLVIVPAAGSSSVSLVFSISWIAPVYAGAGIPDTTERRQAMLMGYVVGTGTLSDLLERSVRNTPAIPETIYIAADGQASAQPVQTVARYTSGTGWTTGHVPVDLAALPGQVVTLPITVIDRTWNVIFHFPPEVIDAAKSRDEWVWLGAGLILTALIALILNRELQQTVRVKRMVDAATAALRDEVSGREAAERAAQASAAFVHTVLDNTNDAVVAIDQSGTITAFNRTAEVVFGHAADEAIGQNVKILMPEPYQTDHDGYLRRYRETGVRRIVGTRRGLSAQRKDGSVFPAELAVAEAVVDGNPIFIGTLSDVTESKRVEAQLAQALKMEAVGQLTGGLAHDFNNLLGVIIGNLDLAGGRLGADPQLREYVDAALRSALRGAELVRQLLAFSRRQPLQPKVIDLNERLPGMAMLLKRTLGEEITINTRPADGLWPVLADPVQVEAAVLNLAINARDAMPGGGMLTIETANAHLDADYVAQNREVVADDYAMIAVTDNGTGMPPEIVARAFEPFFTTKDTGKGSGLGLSMVYGFAKQSGGHAKIYSELGHGTTIKIYLPRARALAEEAAAPAGPAVALERGHEAILLVEDNPQLRKTAERQLTHLGYRVQTAENGPAALALLGGGATVDLLLTDVVMPGGMTGHELAAQARERRPGLKVLMSTGYAEASLTNGHGRDEAWPVLGKPYRQQELAQMVRRVLDGAA